MGRGAGRETEWERNMKWGMKGRGKKQDVGRGTGSKEGSRTWVGEQEGKQWERNMKWGRKGRGKKQDIRRGTGSKRERGRKGSDTGLAQEAYKRLLI